ncbi:hypothetical protein [Leuconostoc citreum]|uniref:hypothetical protein n=1 Tax=Leuconostoc citreum TaxID=33964 RepID=UPI0032DE5CF4
MNTILFGLGPHAHRIYLKYFNQHANEIGKILIVDLETNKEKVEKYLGDAAFNYEIIYFPSSIRNLETTPKFVEKIISDKISTDKYDSAIISTEPKSHMMYINFSLKYGLKVMADKPLTAPVGTNTLTGAKKVWSDYVTILENYHNSASSRFDVMAQRRGHTGFLKARDILNEIVRKFNVPITKIKIFHSDGNWVMPNEIISRENHPYKYGYGKLMHSGYHFVDLVPFFMEVNWKNGFQTPHSNMAVCVYKHSDFLKFYGADFYRKLGREFESIDNDIFRQKNIFKNFGEYDVSAMIDYVDKDGDIMTQVMMEGAQSGFSKRAWFQEPFDTYKGNGRIRHEMVEVAIGPLLNLKIFSYQAKEIAEEKDMINDIGKLDHFEIDVFRNEKLIGGEAFEQIKPQTKNKQDHYIGQNEQARFDLLDAFYFDKQSDASLEGQKETIKLMSKIYEEISRKTTPKESVYDIRFIQKNGQISVFSVNTGDDIESTLIRQLQIENLAKFSPIYLGYEFNHDRLTYIYSEE